MNPVHSPRLRGYRRALLGAVLLVAGCSGDSPTTRTEPVARVDVSAPATTVAVGDTLALSAVPRDADGAALSGRAVEWSSDNPAVLKVDASGRASGEGVGTATVTARSEGQSGQVAITVTPARVTSLTLSRDTATLHPGAAFQLTATARDRAGNALAGRAVAWASSAEGVARVDAAGLVTAVAPGTATITASSEGRTATATLAVVPVPIASLTLAPDTATLIVGATRTLRVTARDAAGNELGGRQVVLVSSNNAVAALDGLTVRAVAPGTATITATAEGRTAQATITVVPRPVATVEVSPASATVEVGRSVDLGAIARDAEGNALSGRAVTWSTSTPGIATVSATGVVTGVAAGGPVTITATVEGRTGTASVTIVPRPVAAVEVSPASATVEVGRTANLGAIARDVEGNALSGRAVAWSSSNPEIAAVSPMGVVTGVAAGGPVTITATVEGRTGTAAITVIPRPVATVEVSPPSATIEVGRTVDLGAVARDAEGNALSGRAVTWSTSSPGIATVSATGVVTGVAAGGPVTITATVEGRTGTASVTVVPRPVATVEVSPPSATIEVGRSVDLGAIARDAEGNALSGRAVTWSTSSPGIATVSATGVVAGVAAGGPVTITATVEGRTGTASITVVPRPVATVEVSPASATIVTGGSVDLGAVARDAEGNVLTGRAVTWSSSNPGVATVSATGVVTGVAAGGPVTITAVVEGRTGTASVTVQIAFTQVSAGSVHTCALATGGTAYCWGSNEYGQLGNGQSGSLAARTTPVRVSGGLVFSQLAAGDRHTCGRTPSGRAYCWGWALGGQLGNGSKADSNVPVEVAGGHTFAELTAGFAHTCGRTDQGAAYCWGSNYRGQLGTGGDGSDVTTPAAVAGGHSFTRLEAGSDWTCGIAGSGGAQCWGNHYEGQLGIGTASETCDNLPCARTPTPVAGSIAFKEISAGYNHTCAIALDGAAYCWGISGAGALGNGTDGPGAGSTTPVAVSGGLSFAWIAAENQTSCGITTGGDTYCWGNNGLKHGNGTGANTSTPVRAATGLALRSVSIGQAHTCGVTVQDQAYCWGSNYAGQLGDGTSESRSLPVQVRNPAS